MKKLLLITMLILAACAAPEVVPEPEPVACCMAMTAECLSCVEGVSVEEFCADNADVIGCFVEEPVVPEPELFMDEDVAALQEKAAKVSNYRFLYAELPENRALNRYYIRGDFVRVELFTPMTREANSFDVVYLDLVNQKAVAYCEQGNSVICPDPEQIVERVDFADYRIEFPHEFMARLDNGVKTSGLTYDGQVADVIITNIDGADMRVIVNKFYGIPMKIEYGEEGIAMRDFAFGTVTEEQVTPPSGW